MALLTHLGPTPRDTAAVVAGLGLVARWVGLAMLLPALVSLLLGQHRDASALLLGAAVGVLLGALLQRGRLPGRLSWTQAFTLAGGAWAVGTGVAAVPLALSGHHATVLQAVVEAMAGLTTTGLVVVDDLDHLGVGMNLWRHLLHVVGAVAALLVVATIRQRGQTFVATSNVAESGDHHVLPRRGRSVRAAVGLVAVWSVVGTLVLFPLALLAGATPGRALLHAVTLATSAFTTGGFTLTSASAGALHAATVQLVLLVLMVAGATSLVLHRSLWARRIRGIRNELDVRVAGITGGTLLLVVLLGLRRAEVFEGATELVRQGLFTLVAAHTTTGMTPGPGRLLVTGWGDMAPAGIVAAMAIGGMAGSAAGGVGTLRVGILAKGIARDVRRLLLPESAMVPAVYLQSRRHVLTDRHVRAAATIVLLMLASVFGAAVVELATTSDGDLPEALFHAVSAVSTTGITVGFIDAGTDQVALVVTGLLMWFGRLEFLAVLAALGMVARYVPGVGGRG